MVSSVAEILPYLSIIGFVISISVITYKIGKWRQKTEAERIETKKMLETLCKDVKLMPEHFWSKFIDAYELLEKTTKSIEKEKKEK